MKPVSTVCARSDRDCRKCSFRDCNCDCHKTAEQRSDWKSLLKAHAKKRYFMQHGKSGVWYVMDNGTLKNPKVTKVAECGNKLVAWKMVQALNKQNQ